MLTFLIRFRVIGIFFNSDAVGGALRSLLSFPNAVPPTATPSRPYLSVALRGLYKKDHSDVFETD